MQITSPSLMTIPKDCLNYTVSFLGLEELLKTSQVCKKLFSIIDETMFCERYKKEFPYIKNDSLNWRQNCIQNIRSLNFRNIKCISRHGIKTFYTSRKNLLIANSDLDTKCVPYKFYTLDPFIGPISTFDMLPLPDHMNLSQVVFASKDKIYMDSFTDPLLSSKECAQLKGQHITEIKWVGNAGFITGTSKGRLSFWFVSFFTPPELSHEIQAHDAFICCIQTFYSMNRSRLAFSGATDGSLKAWSLDNRTFTNIGSSKAHKGSISSLCYNPHGSFLLTSSSIDNFIAVFDLNPTFQSKPLPMQKVHSFEAHQSGISDMKFANQNLLITAGNDKQIKLWKKMRKKTFSNYYTVNLNYPPLEITDVFSTPDQKKFTLTYVTKDIIGRLKIIPETNEYSENYVTFNN